MAKFGIGARVIDLLGRQQVAGTPTAISELFKNAHDAYARAVDVDFYRSRDLLILRDDGVGMTSAEFQKRWLTAATDSKRSDGFTEMPPADLDQEPRLIMGEKGIGRLAIAVLGPQVLVLTRSKAGGRDAPVVCGLLNWAVFSLPGVGIDEIDIPVREVGADRMPDAKTIGGMIEEMTANLVDLQSRTDGAAIEDIRAEIARFDIDPAAIAAKLPAGPVLTGDGHGTHFYISPVRDELRQDIDGGRGERERERATSMQKVLLGFNNTMIPGRDRPAMETHFRDHAGNGLYIDLIGENEFFTPGEFDEADHHIEGAFDARGQFTGTIRVYGAPPRHFGTHWPDSQGQDTRCGPFQINFAYVQGLQTESRLDQTRWGAITAKLNKIGGLYIYRDGMRILPYGDSDYDFLDIEQRRSKGAGYYFFSYRRMFGVIDITRRLNGGLLEKAGREGFQENTAYRQFRSILENFLIQIAASFFRKGGTEADEFFAEEERLKRTSLLAERRRKQVQGRRKTLAAELEAFLRETSRRSFDADVSGLVSDALESLRREEVGTISVAALTHFEREVRRKIEAVDVRARIIQPRGMGLTRELARHWSRYEVERKRLVAEVFQPAYAKLDDAVRATAARLDLALDVRQHVGGILQDRAQKADREIKTLAKSVRSGANSLGESMTRAAQDSLRAFEANAAQALMEFERTDFEQLSASEFTETQARLEKMMEANASEHVAQLDRLARQLKRVSSEDALSEETFESMETELEDRRERETESLQLAQMGQAIGIVHHEFHSVVQSVRTNIRRLSRWADRNPQLRSIYNDISESYAHLDGYLSLFAPLNRRLSQTKRLIEGREIAGYIGQLLGDRMRRHDVEFEASDAFAACVVEEFASTLFPSFVNIADNSIFWMNHGDGIVDLEADAQPARRKRLTLDFIDDAFVIADSGPGILPSDEGAVFETGFSRKPNGSGLGLYITRELLQRNGYLLTLDPYSPGRGATFRIKAPATALVKAEEDEA